MYKKTLAILSLVLVASMLFALPGSAAEKPTLQQDGLSAQQYEQMVRDTLAALAASYTQEDLRAFMNLVSPDFAGDDFMLYRAVRRDFRFFDNINLRLDVDGFAIDRKGKAQVTIKYNRNVIANKDGRSYKDRGLTQLAFHIHEGQAKLYAMKFPLLFGLSEGLQVASGVVRSAETATVLTVDRRGNVSVEPFRVALEAANSNSVVRGIVSLRTDGTGMDSWSFADNRKHRGVTLQGDFAIGADLLFRNGTKWLKVTTDFDAVTQAPDPGTTAYNAATITPVAGGEVYVMQLAGGKFAVIEIRDYQMSAAAGIQTAIVRYKYQPNGSRNF